MKISPVSTFVLLVAAGLASSIQPPVMLINPPTQVLFNELEPVTLPCKASGEPQPTYTWKKDKQDLNMADSHGRIFTVANEGTLVLKLLKKRDAGTYQCFANNSYGVAMSGITELRLAFLKPYINDMSSTATIRQGLSFSVPCNKPTSYPEANMTWALQHSDGSLKELNFTELIQVDDEGTLVFVSVLEEVSSKDAPYVCMASNMFVRAITVGRNISIYTFPEKPNHNEIDIIKASPKETISLKGDTIKLLCIFRGFPTPEIRWYRNNKVIQQTTKYKLSKFNHRLNILDAKFEDEGDYECQGSEMKYGQTLQRSMNVKIESKPEWTNKPKSIVTGAGGSATFVCNGTGKPPTNEPVWYINGKKINEYPNKTKFIVQKTNLTVINLTPQDSMTIQCNISNIHGYIFTNVFLNVLVKMRMEHYPSDLEVNKGANALFTCAATTNTIQDNDLQTIWFKDGKAVAIDGDKISQNSLNNSLTVRSVTREDVGRYTCVVTNGLHSVNASAFLAVKGNHPPVMLINPPTQVLLQELETVTLPCKASGEPQPTYTWKKDKQDFNMADSHGRIFTLANEGTLVFKQLERKDAGIYQCFATNSYGVATSDNVELQFAFLNSSTNQEVKIIRALTGSSLLLPCDKPTSYPEANVTWLLKRNNGPAKAFNFTKRILMDNQGNLAFVNVQKEDAFKDTAYVCVTSNTFARVNKTSKIFYLKAIRGNQVFVNVQKENAFKDTAYVCVVSNTFAQVNKTSKIFYLEAIPANLAFVNVQKEDAFKDTAYVCVVSNTFARVNKTSKIFYLEAIPGNLAFVNVQKEDTFKDTAYVCVTSNTFAQVNKTSKIFYLEAIPEWPAIHQLHILSASPNEVVFLKGDTVKLECIFGGYPKPEIRWYRNNKMIKQTTKYKLSKFNHRLNILDAKFEDEGDYECQGSEMNHGQILQRSMNVKIESKPEWTIKPKSVVVSDGRSATFICDGTSKPPISKHSWYINGVDIYKYLNRSKFILRETNLTIIDLTPQDSMTIQCNISNIHGYIFTYAYLRVFAEPPEMLEDKEKTQKHAEGQSTNITCRTTGYDSVDVHWSKDNKPVTGGRYRTLSNGNLNIKNLVLEDSGVYRCNASNKYGMVFATRTLIVRRKTRIEHIPDLLVYKGQDAKFTCVITTDPMEADNLRIVWLKDDDVIDTDKKGIIQNPKDNSLIIRNVTKKDAGNYSCVATNGFDVTKAFSLLRVRANISIEHSPSDLEVNREADAKFMCAAVTDIVEANNLSIIWLKDDKIMDIDGERIIQDFQNNSLLIRNVTKNDVGLYTCVATNGLDFVNASAFLTVKGNQPPVMLINPPTQVLFNKLETVTLPCKASGEPQPTYTWKKDKQDLNMADSHGRIFTVANEGTLVLKLPKKRDAGTYQCFANNSYGVAMSGIIELRLAFLQPFIRADPETIIGFPGASLLLPCDKPISYPEAGVEWILQHKDGSREVLDYTERILKDHQGNLIFANILEKDSYKDTTYVCMAFNAFKRQSRNGKPFYLKTVPMPPENHPPHLLSVTPNEMVFLKGDTVKLECIFGGHPTPEIQWFRHTEVSRTHIKQNTKYQIFSFNRQLNILDAEFEDEGEYECQASAKSFGEMLQHVTRVKIEAKPEWVTKPKSVVTSPGSSATFICNGTGKPIDNPKWYINGKSINKYPNKTKFIVQETNLTVIDLTPQDSMTIQCNISNIHGYIFTNVFLNVLADAPEMLEKKHKILKVPDGQSINITCKTTGHDSAQVHWSKDNKALTGDRYRTLSNGNLKIKNLVLNDSGVYRCNASNKFGMVSATRTLIVRRKTKIEKSVSEIVAKEGNNVTFTCVATTDPREVDNLQIIWLKNGKAIDMDDERIIQNTQDNSLTINGVIIRKDDGRYTCVVTNGFDWARKSTILHITTPWRW